MLMGPVFRAEVLRAARQRRYYVLRLVYGLLLLLLVWIGYERMRLTRPVTRLADVAAFAADTFYAFAVVQLITLLLLVPAVYGGAIADEKQRKSLHYLMASQLSGVEIILDKVLGRSSHLVVFVAIGLPVVSLLGLFGGISAASVIVAYVGTFSTAAFAIAMTVLISTLARRVRDAIVTSYLLMLGWLFLPSLLLAFGPTFFRATYAWIRPVNGWLFDTSPFGVWFRSRFFIGLGLTTASMIHQLMWMIGNQLAGAMVLLVVAVWRLRPTFRRQEEMPARRARGRAKAGRGRRRWFAHPECGDDPILWKERYFTPVDRFTRVVVLPAIVVITLPLVLLTETEGHLGEIIADFLRHPLAARWPLPGGFLRMLQVDLCWYVAFWLLAVAGASASSVAIERERDTWVSLTATPLTGREILRGKVLGALWHQRGFAVVLVFLWALGLVTGAVHPLGLLASIALVALLTWFVATLGVYCSLRASNTSRALGVTLLVLAFFNGYPVIVFLWFLRSINWSSSFSVLGAMPSLAAEAMIAPRTFDGGWRTLTTWAWVPPMVTFLGGLILSVVCIYAATALALSRRILGELDRWLDSPPPSRMPATGVAPARDLEEVTAR
jgi:hypothetical protein